jgi:superfamily II DNA or RNA helicase
MGPLYQPGDVVVRRNRRDERGVITAPAQKRAGNWYYKVLFPSSQNPATVPESDLEKVNPEEPLIDQMLAGRFGAKSTFSRLLTFERLRQPVQDTLYSLRASRTEFQPYQFKPLLKFLRSSKQRLLIADEVGLGKTIEAGFILCEMLARHPHTFRRVLIVCKAALCGKWQMEMRKRFDLKFEIWKAEQLRQYLRQYNEEDDPELWAICSLESFRNAALMEEWEAVSPILNLLIIDEAHHLKNSSTKSHKACRTAAATADAVLALTATPIQMGSKDLFNLLSLLDEEEFASFEYFEACMLFNCHIVEAERRVTTSDPERFQHVRKILASLGGDDISSLPALLRECGVKQDGLDLIRAWSTVAETLQGHPLYKETLRLLENADPSNRRHTVEIQRNLAELNLLSRIFSRTRRKDVHIGSKREAHVKRVDMTDAEMKMYRVVLKYVSERYALEGKDPALLFGLIMPQRQLASCIPAMVEFYEQEIGWVAGGLDSEQSDLDPEDWNGDRMPDFERTRRDLADTIRHWHENGSPDSKFSVLESCLKELQETQPGEPIVIFSYFKKTLEYLARQLGALGYSCTVISGSIDPEERDKRIAQFREGKYQILLSSEVGSEGLDFQFCHILFNYDLPWNPMVVEQRIGRLDRFGQKAEKILIFNLSAPGTIEDEILNRLYNRIRLFESYIGDLEAILGDEISELTRDLFDPALSDEDRAERIEAAGVLLEQRKLQFEEWEKAAPQFIGHDEFYRDEVERAQKLGRYIRPEDLATLVHDFLEQFDKKSDLTELEPGRYGLKAGDQLRKWIVSLPADDQKTRFLSALDNNRLVVTFDSELAERDRNLTFVHVRHFFVQGIIREYQKRSGHFHPVAAIELASSDVIPAGAYLYLIARATIHAAREQDTLLPVIVNLKSKQALGEDESETCLARMVSEGRDMPEPLIDADTLGAVYEVAESVLAERFEARRQQVERLNEAFVSARLASVKESFNQRIGQRKALLEQALNNKRQASYVRMLEGGIRNLEAELDRRISEIEHQRTVTADFHTIAAGILQVTES